MFKPLLLVLVPCCLYALSLSKDTIYSWQYTNNYGRIDTILINRSADTIKVDSMSVRAVESHTSIFELSFGFVRGSSYSFGLYWGGLTSRQPFAVPPQSVLAITGVCLDMCCHCPVSPVPAIPVVPAITGLNDPLVVMLYFYSNSGMDSITVVSIQKIISMGVTNNALIKSKITRKENPNVYNLKGQAVNNNEVTSVEINKGDKKVKVSK